MANRDVKRININIPGETLNRIDEYAERMSVTRTSAILFLVSQSLDNQKMVTNLDLLLKAYQDEKEKK